MTTANRFTVQQLRKMTLAELEQHGTEFGLLFNKNHPRAERVRRIAAAYSERDLATDSVPSDASSTPPRVSAGLPKPEFERLIDSPELPEDLPSAQRGGERPGAGRPEGMTEEIAAYNRLSKQPHPGIRMAIEKLFDKWAARSQCPALKLSKEEAFALALPWTNVYEISPIAGKLPPWFTVLLSCLWATWSIVDTKAELARAHNRGPQTPTNPVALGSLN